MEQGELDHKMIVKGKERYRRRVGKARDHGRETSTPAGQVLLSDVVAKTRKQLQDWLDRAKVRPGRLHSATKCLRKCDLDVTALVAATICIDKAVINATLVSTANAIGVALEDEIRFREFRKSTPRMWHDLVQKTKRTEINRAKRVFHDAIKAVADEGAITTWTYRERHHLGIVCVDLVRKASGIIEITNQGKNQENRVGLGVAKHDPARVKLNPDVVDWLSRSHEAHELRYPYLMPTVDMPQPWDAPYGGGYTSNQILKKPIYRAHSSKALEFVTPHRMPDVFRALNGLQDTSWRINVHILAMVKYFVEERVDAPSVTVDTDLYVPEKPEDIDTNEDARRVWRKGAAAAWDDHKRRVSEGARTARVYEVARDLVNQSIHFPHRCDFRGRMYPLPVFLSPQGDDLSKGLLEFAEGHPIKTKEARDWLAIHGANCHGEDKTPFPDRIRWVEEHEAHIRECSQDPLSHLGSTLWTQADKPWQFLQFAFEWDELRTAEENGEEHISHIPVAMDGSNNGLQLFSLLLRDEEGGMSTNVVPSETPQDVYQDVADAVTVKLVAESEDPSDPAKMELARRWLSFSSGRLPRAACKRPVMVLPYGGTRHSASDYVSEWYEGECKERGEDVMADLHHPEREHFYGGFYASCYLANHIWDSIHEVVVAANQAMTWLQDVADACCEYKIPICWTTPSGFRVHQEYRKEHLVRIKTILGDRIVKHRVKLDGDAISRRRQRNGISPNFIHSLDAAILALTLCRCQDQGIRDFVAVHDSFGVHASHAASLATVIREVVADVFSGDLLQDFADEILSGLPSDVILPDLPPRGDLDVRSVLASKYFFA